MCFKCLVEVNGKVDVEYYTSSACVEEKARVLGGIITNLGPHTPPHGGAVSAGS